MKTHLLNEDTKFSMRKLLALTVAVCWFAAHVVWFAINPEIELPMSYVVVDASVILFYFGKKTIEGLKLVSK
ncbi:MAG: hypothetical protein PF484_10635 [Bacteroidales bacterium]|jgi:hypothetical protein|nr:hypothetical protein [Bacteroidales bacterium]